MSSEQHDPQFLTQSLLGSLADTEAERLDELSITDDEVAWRLTAAENDLVDAYVRGELSGEALRRFETHYLSSQKRRDKVRFGPTLRLLENRAPTLPSGAAPATQPPGDSPARQSPVPSA